VRREFGAINGENRRSTYVPSRRRRRRRRVTDIHNNFNNPNAIDIIASDKEARMRNLKILKSFDFL